VAVFLFAGPTLARDHGSVQIPADVRLLPPVGRGDVDALVQQELPGVAVLVDGLFHDRLAVGHEEIRKALEAGWSVWGLSSMGAIRAREMRSHGMRGFGRVYDLYETEEDFQDDEVALLHAPDGPYRPVSEPMVHLRAALQDWSLRGWINPDAARVAVDHLKSLWFGYRTLRALESIALAKATGDKRPNITRACERFDQYRLKTADLVDFLRVTPWRS
jgi:hypothetical protein